jgi:hypothetical protein
MIVSVIFQQRASDFSITDWTSNCPTGYEHSCRAQGAVFRISFALSIFFVIQFLLTYINTRLYDDYWLLKILGFIGLVIGFFYAEPKVFDLNGYAWFARIAGFFFIIFQQVIIIDFAFTWNEKWVKNSTGNLMILVFIKSYCIIYMSYGHSFLLHFFNVEK